MVSIIVPVLNEEKTIENSLIKLNNLKGSKEIIVVDGGSKDKTVTIAKKYGKVVKSKKGRAYQMNKGASISKGDILWFVHSDSIVDLNSITYIEKCITKGYVGGGFSLYFYDFNTLFMKYIRVTSNIRACIFKIFYGDQGIFVEKNIFNRIGGYPNLYIMEDLEFSKKIKKIGKMKLISKKIGTSARRFKKGGQFKTHLLMHKLRILHIMGISNSTLNKMYREVRQ